MQGILSLVNTRMEEERERPEAVEALRTVLKLAKKAAANVTLLIKPDDPNPWYTPEDIEKVGAGVVRRLRPLPGTISAVETPP